MSDTFAARIPDDMMPDTPWPDDRFDWSARDAAPPDDQLTIGFEFIERLASKLIPDAAVLLAPDVDAMVTLLFLLRRAIAQLKFADEELEAEIVRAMPGKEVVVAGVGQVTLRSGSKRTQWQHDELFAAIIGRIADEPSILVDDNGERLPPVHTVERVVSLLREAVTPSWKLGGIRGTFHLDPEDYCHSEWSRKSIQTPTIADPFKSGDGQ